MKIIRVTATPLNVPVTIDILGLNKQTSLSVCLTEIETELEEEDWRHVGPPHLLADGWKI